MEKENMFMMNPNWDNNNSVGDQSDPFESALSSMVSSPTASDNNNCNNNNIVLRELIGRLGTICNNTTTNNNSANTSCYSTPLNSPPKLNLSSYVMMDNHHHPHHHQQINGNFNNFPNLAPFATDPGFAERAARFSCFANNQHKLSIFDSPGKMSRVSNSHSVINNDGGALLQQEQIPVSAAPENKNFGDFVENSSVSELIMVNSCADPQSNDASNNNISSRKRKAIPRGKGKDTNPPKDSNVGGSENVSEPTRSEATKRSKSSESVDDANKGTDQKQQSKEENKPEPPKDYIHVRARRGQATDAHSLAERVRREKISERMKVLQDLVPGCNKVTGKAVMLDEIINYVQSLQRQVEFLSMKLATVNPGMDINTEALMSKDMFQPRGTKLTHHMYPSDGYPFQSQPNLHNAIMPNNGTEAPLPFSANNFSTLPRIDNFTETASQGSTFWEDDLHSVVQMGFGQNQSQNFNGISPPMARMKVEL